MSIFGNLFPSKAAGDSELFKQSRARALRAATEQASVAQAASPSGAEKRKRVRRERQGGDTSQSTSAPQHDSRSMGVSPQLVGAAQQDAHALTNAGQKKKKKKQRQLSAEAKSEAAPAAQQAAQLAGGHSAERNESPESRGSPSRATEQSSDAQAAGSPRAEAAHSETLAYTDEQLERTIFVGNVPVTSGRQHAASKLKALFKQHGDVESVRLRNVPVDTESKMPKALQIKAGKVAGERGSATAFVRFAAAESVAAALASNMALFEGAHIRVDRAAAPSRGGGGVQYEAKRSVFLGNLAFDTQEEDVIALFNTAAHEPQLDGAVEAVRLVKDSKTSVGKGIGYVLLRNRTAVLAALNLNGTECKGRKMRVMRVKASAGGANAQKVAPKRKGRAGGNSKGGRGASAALRVGGDPADFAGARTKGKKKGALRGAKGSSPAVHDGAVAKKGRDGKRPAVAARKAKQLLAAGKLSAKNAKGVLKKARRQGQGTKKSGA